MASSRPSRQHHPSRIQRCLSRDVISGTRPNLLQHLDSLCPQNVAKYLGRQDPCDNSTKPQYPYLPMRCVRSSLGQHSTLIDLSYTHFRPIRFPNCPLFKRHIPVPKPPCPWAPYLAHPPVYPLVYATYRTSHSYPQPRRITKYPT